MKDVHSGKGSGGGGNEGGEANRLQCCYLVFLSDQVTDLRRERERMPSLWWRPQPDTEGDSLTLTLKAKSSHFIKMNFERAALTAA